MDPVNKVEVPQDNLDQVKALVKEYVEKLNQNPIIEEARRRWQEHAPDWARYHRPEHTDDVLEESLFFAIADGITDERQLELLGIMAAFHDVGMTMEPSNPDNLRQDHEARGAILVREIMTRAGSYTEEEIKIVTESIEDTKILFVNGVLIQQQARHELGKYLLDADVSNFGRSDFSQKSEDEFAELQLVLKPPPDRSTFNKNTLGLIKNHHFQSQAGIKYRTRIQEENIFNLEKVA